MPNKNNNQNMAPELNTDGAENPITGGSLIDDLEQVLNAGATDTPASAPTPAAEPTDNFSNNGAVEKAPKKKSPAIDYTSATGHALTNLTRGIQKEREARVGDNLYKSKEELSKSTRIVGYIAKTNEKIDFKRTLQSPKSDDTSVTALTYSFSLNMYQPPKPDRVVITYPMNLYTVIRKSIMQNTTLSTNEIQKASEDDSVGHSTKGVTILSLKSGTHEYYDWVSTYLSHTYITEAQEIFEPFITFRGKDNTPKILKSYEDADAYKLTGGRPGVVATLYIANTNKNNHMEGDVLKLDMLSNENREHKVVYRNTGRPRYLTPNNYISDKRWLTVPGKPAENDAEANALSLMYFKRFMNPTNLSEPKLSKTQTEKGYTYSENPASPIHLEGNQESSFMATCFKPGSDFWENTGLTHWYDVEVVGNGGYAKRALKPEEIRIVKREEVKSTGKSAANGVNYKNCYDMLQAENSNYSYTWDSAIPAKMKAALGDAIGDFTYTKYIEKRNSTKVDKPKAKKNVSIDVTIPGMTFDEAVAFAEKYFSNGGTGDFGI